MTYDNLIEFLIDSKDEKFAEFSKKLSNSDYKVIGVKNPILRQIIKQHVDDMELNPEDFQLGEYLEIDFIYFGLSLTRLKNTNQKLSFLKGNIKYAKSWAITDMVSTYIKKISFNDYFDFFLKAYNAKNIYERRMAYVLGLKFYKEKEILGILPLIIKNEDYMVMMSQAWLLATVAINYIQEVYDFLNNLDDEILKRKTISKISDSFRFDEETKNKFKLLRN